MSLAVEDRIDFELEAAQIRIDEQRRFGKNRRCRLRIGRELRLVIDDLHRAAAENERGANEDWKAEFARDRAGLAETARRLAVRPRDAQARERRIELLAILGHVERRRSLPTMGTPRRLSSPARLIAV